jgi:hypothetical protein
MFSGAVAMLPAHGPEAINAGSAVGVGAHERGIVGRADRIRLGQITHVSGPAVARVSARHRGESLYIERLRERFTNFRGTEMKQNHLSLAPTSYLSIHLPLNMEPPRFAIIRGNLNSLTPSFNNSMSSETRLMPGWNGTVNQRADLRLGRNSVTHRMRTRNLPQSHPVLRQRPKRAR